jgi:hypothetical protein
MTRNKGCAMRVSDSVLLRLFLVIAMFAFTAVSLCPEPAEAASRRFEREARASLTGRWYWRAICPRGRYQGAAFIAEHGGGRFSGQLGNTSFYDRGTISAGRLRGRDASFILNAFGKSARIRALLVVTSRSMSARAAYASETYGRCQLVFTKI